MAGNLVDIDELVPDDLIFRYKGVEYAIDGDPSTERVFEFIKLYEQLTEAQQKQQDDGSVAGQVAEVEKMLLTIRGKILALFQERNPEMKELPFGMKGTQIVLGHILGLLGVTVEPDEVVDPPAPARPKAQPKRATSVKTRTRK